MQSIFCKTFQTITEQLTDSNLKQRYSQVYLIFDICTEELQSVLTW